MFSLESPHWGDSNEYTQYTIFNMKKKIGIKYPKSAAEGFFLGTKQSSIQDQISFDFQVSCLI